MIFLQALRPLRAWPTASKCAAEAKFLIEINSRSTGAMKTKLGFPPQRRVRSAAESHSHVTFSKPLLSWSQSKITYVATFVFGSLCCSMLWGESIQISVLVGLNWFAGETFWHLFFFLHVSDTLRIASALRKRATSHFSLMRKCPVSVRSILLVFHAILLVFRVRKSHGVDNH